MSANHEQGNKPTGFKIDSALIHAATTSDLQSELSGLGVSVYDQNEFEEGVLDQINKEFSKRAVEQQKKFLLKEHSNVKKEIATLQDEIKTLSKTICSLLTRPLCDVVGKLREVKASQEQKKKHLHKLQARDKELCEKITFQPDGDEGVTTPLATPPGGSSDLSCERLVQLGHLTPFGTEVEDLPVGVEGPASLEMGADEAEDKSTQPGPASMLLDPDDEDQSLSFGSISSSDVMSQQMEIPHEQEKEGEEEEGEEDESLRSEDDEYVPTPHEIASSFSEHLSGEEELAPPSDKKGKKRLREVHSDESEDELVETNWSKRSHNSRRGKKKTLDDGDEEMYQLRISKYGQVTADPAEPDVVFSGGFRVPGSIWHKLYRYQQTGVRWLWELHGQQAGGIVGDEMGLGKTIQMIAFLAGLNISGLRSDVTGRRGLGPVLILCPATVLHQWVCEFHKWWPPFRVAILHGTGTFSGERQRLVNRMIKCNGVLLTTYAGVRIYKDHLLGQKWDYLVLDEGHKIRNPDADVTIVCKQFATPHRILLSGSPMQNNLRELWSLFDFVFPGKLGTLPVFMEQFSVPITLGGYANATEVQVRAAYKCACVLRDTIGPYLLRRLKADVKIQLPDKNEQVLFCRLTEYQREVYQDFINSPQVLAMLAGGKQIFSGLVTLRKLCNHPDLVMGDYCPAGSGEAGEEEEDFIKIDIPKERRDQGDGEEEGYGHWRRSGKMIVVESLLKLWKAQNHRVLLFTQGRQMLNILEQFVSSRGYTYQRMDGCSSIANRQPMVNKFNEDDSIFVFLLTTRVGGLGVNLIGADRVLIYDPDWNPSTDTQARERAWRIGQTRPVTIYRLLCSGTIEEKIYHRQIFKQFLTNRVLKDPRQRRFFKSNDLHELFTLGTADGSTTDTGAIFAGTHSEQIPQNAVKRKHRTSHHRSSEQTNTFHQTSGIVSEQNYPKLLSSASRDLPGTSRDLPGTSRDLPGTSRDLPGTSRDLPGTSRDLPGTPEDRVGGAAESSRHSGCHDNRRKKSNQRRGTVDGVEIVGVERTRVFQCDDEQSSQKQDDFVLKNLFKRTGVQSAMHHDVIMNSADPDYVLVEAEAKAAAQSASKVLKESRKQCMRAPVDWPTWTGHHGIAGAPKQRFGPHIAKQEQSNATSSRHFDGELSQQARGSLNTSSGEILAKIKSRNVHSLPPGSVSTSENHRQLLTDIRNFIATQCKVTGQATTKEILTKFQARLPTSDTAVFRSMLHEICNFSRHHGGEGLWQLKPEFR